MYRIAAYITAYEDIDAVKRCITAIKNQSYPVEKIYIIDNSTTPISNLINDHHLLIFDHHPDNIGIAAGLNISMNWSKQENYDFLWTFDQDSEAMPEALASLINTYQNLRDSQVKPGIIACLPIDVSTGYELHGLVFTRHKFREIPESKRQNDYYECDLVITSGSLVVVNSLNDISPLNENLFIDAVDWDLCLKLKEQNYSIYVDKNAVLNHHYGSSYHVNIPLLKKQLTISSYSSLRYYYISRNQTFMETRYAFIQQSGIITVIYRLINMNKKLLKIVLFEKNQVLLKLYATIIGTIQGLQGNLNKRW